MIYESQIPVLMISVNCIWRIIPQLEKKDGVQKVTFVQHQIDEVSPPEHRDTVVMILDDMVTSIPYSHGAGMAESEFLSEIKKRCEARKMTFAEYCS